MERSQIYVPLLMGTDISLNRKWKNDLLQFRDKVSCSSTNRREGNRPHSQRSDQDYVTVA